MQCSNHPEIVERLQLCARCLKEYCPDCLVELGGKPYCANGRQQPIE